MDACARRPGAPQLNSKSLCRGTGSRYYERRPFAEFPVTFQIATEQETDGRWLAEVDVLPGVMAYGTTRTDAVAKVRADVEAQVARADERGIDPGQSLVVEGQSIINKKRPGETKSLLD